MVKALLLVSMLLPSVAWAEAWQWDVVPESSSIRWQAIQNNAPVEGEFTSFSAHIAFHPDHLDKSKAEVNVKTGSVDAGYDEVITTLQEQDWFHVDNFPTATFTSISFTKQEDGTYISDATLTIKEQTVPLTLNFSLDEFTDSRAIISGTTTIKRTDFNVGWDDTSSVADEVIVMIQLEATR